MSGNRRGGRICAGGGLRATGASGDLRTGQGAYAHLAELGQHLPEQGVQRGELSAQVDVTLKATAIGQCVQVGDRSLLAYKSK